MNDAAQIEQEIRSAFPSKRPIPFGPINGTSLHDEPLATARLFRDKDDWSVLDPKWLDRAPNGLGTALSFMSDEAARFYIPAYMIADLHGAIETVEPEWTLIYGLDGTYGTDAAKRTADRWRYLSVPQVLAISRYLEWKIAQDRLGLNILIAPALASYWYQHPILG